MFGIIQSYFYSRSYCWSHRSPLWLPFSPRANNAQLCSWELNPLCRTAATPGSCLCHKISKVAQNWWLSVPPSADSAVLPAWVCAPGQWKGRGVMLPKFSQEMGPRRPPPMPFHRYSHLSNALLSVQGKKTLPDESLGRGGYVRKYIDCFGRPAFLFPYFLLPTIPQADCSYLPTFHFKCCLSLISKGYFHHIWRTLWSEPSRFAHGYSEVHKAVSCVAKDVCVCLGAPWSGQVATKIGHHTH